MGATKRDAVVLIFTRSTFLWCIVFCLLGCSGELSKNPMFYDSKKEPIYIEDIYVNPLEIQIGRIAMGGDLARLKSLHMPSGGLDFKGRYGITPLWLAVRYNHEDVVQYLLDNGASPNAQIKWVPSIIGTAAENNPRVLDALLNAGASVDLQSDGFAKLLPIHHASRHESTESLSLLLKAGADINARAAYGVTPLQLAVSSRKLDNAIFLLDNGSDSSLESDNGETIKETLKRITLNEENTRKAELIFEMVERGAE
jgi:ankyrin repeat protein